MTLGSLLLAVVLSGALGGPDGRRYPVVACRGSAFGSGYVVIKLGLVGTSFVLERLAL
jgi:hypothetical protein